MYVLSLVFLLASVISLFVGVQGGGLTFVFVSIGFSVLAALFLAASVLRKRSEEPPENEMPESRVEEWRRSLRIPPVRSTTAEEQPYREEPEGPLARESLVGVVDRPLAGRRGAESERSPTARPDPSDAGVLGPDVVVSDRGTYHLPACKLARGSSGEMKRAIAKRLGYVACGVCRPG